MASLFGVSHCTALGSNTLVNIDGYKIQKAPATVYYIPNFVSKEEERHILDRVYKVPKPKWTQLSNRRLQNWGGVPHPNGMLVELIPQWLSTYLDKVWQLGVFEKSCKPNHVLINEYLAGQGIMPHFDGPLFYPTITTLSLGSHAVLDFYVPRSEGGEPTQDTKMSKSHSLLIEPRSLLILQDEMYSKYLHGIEERSVDTLISTDILNWHACEIIRSEFQDEISMQEEENKILLRDTKGNLVSEEEGCHQDKGKKLSAHKFNSEKTGEIVDNMANTHAYELTSPSENMDLITCNKDELGAKVLHRGTRVSLTLRHVPKTSKVKIKLGR